MNYKRIIASKNLRFKILKALRFIPDKLMVKILYRIKMGRRLNLHHPVTFQEKMQWLKIYRRNPEFTTMVDKYAVKEYVASLIGSKYIIPTLGIWNSFDEIDFDRLPDSFVLKTTHSGGNDGVIICHAKSSFNREQARQKLNRSLCFDIYATLREWPYKNVSRRIIAETLITDSARPELIDYKIFCFNGQPRYIQVIQNRNTQETIDFFDTEWNHQVFFGLNPLYDSTIKQAGYATKPSDLDEMLDIAAILSKGTEFLRVDLYNANGRIYFGEITFYPASGLGTFTPSEWNVKLGELIHLRN